MGLLSKNNITFIGIFLMMIPNGIIMCWGNISIYLYSYTIKATGSFMDIQIHWTLALLISVKVAALILSGQVYLVIGKRCTALCGMACFGAGYIVTYFAIEVSVKMMTLSLGILLGMGNGFIEGVSMKYLVDIVQNDSGTKMSRLLIASNGGTILFNQLMTLYVNPNNLSPDVTVGKINLFSQEEVLRNVPRVLLIMAGLSLGLHVIGIGVLRGRNEEESMSVGHLETSTVEYGSCDVDKIEEKDENAHTNAVEKQAINGTLTTHEAKDNESFGSTDTFSGRVGTNNSDSFPETKDKKHNKYIKQLFILIRTRSFCALWFSYFCTDTANILLNNFYKAYGQTWIHDDYLFSILLTVMSFLVVVTKLTGGIVLDQIGHKLFMVIILTGTSLFPFLLYFSAAVDKWFFFLTALAFWTFTSVSFQTWIVATIDIFGKENFNINVGLMMTSAVAMYVLSAPVIEACLVLGGWFYVFLFTSVMNAIGLVTVALFLK